jgi:hypothetical protein
MSQHDDLNALLEGIRTYAEKYGMYALYLLLKNVMETFIEDALMEAEKTEP